MHLQEEYQNQRIPFWSTKEPDKDQNIPLQSSVESDNPGELPVHSDPSLLHRCICYPSKETKRNFASRLTKARGNDLCRWEPQLEGDANLGHQFRSGLTDDYQMSAKRATIANIPSRRGRFATDGEPGRKDGLRRA